MKRIIKAVDFGKEGSHISLVRLPANGQEEVTILKSKEVELEKSEEVQITTSMKKFLEIFFRLWEDEAATLASILGYDVEEWYWDVIGEDTTVEIMKSAVEDPINNKIHKETFENLKKARQEFNKLYKIYEKENKMGEPNVDLQKSIDDAIAVALKKEREKYTELEKSLTAKETELTELRKAAEKKEKEDLTELCKGYSFVDDAEKLSESLFLCKSIKGYDVILDTLEKARTAIKAALETEIGTDEEADLTKKNDAIKTNIDKTQALLKARKEGK